MNAPKRGILIAACLAAMALAGCGGEKQQPDPVATPTCSDGVQNGTETGVDCGGECAACPVAPECTGDADCAPGTCVDGKCVAAEVAACDNGKKDGAETDVDCGGECSGCADGAACAADGDCESGACREELCVTLPPCENGVKDGAETDIDCGGPDCEACEPGFFCLEPTDCANFGMCVGGVCGGTLSCKDGKQNGHEIGVDCGGEVCHGCGAGVACAADTECLSGTCEAGQCTEPEDTCSNGVRDGLESDIDCGGGVCGPCAFGYGCDSMIDCDVPHCEEGMCGGRAMCEDGQLDGRETDLDCGGLCESCTAGKSCLVDEDCLSDRCEAGVCAERSLTCDNGVQDGRETGVDCGASCDACQEGQACVRPTDCVTLACVDQVCGRNLLTIQSSPQSLQCTASGTVVVEQGVSLVDLIVTTPKLSLDENTEAFWVLQPEGWVALTDGRFSGILVVADKALSQNVDSFSQLSLTADVVENNCQTELHVTAPNGSITVAEPQLSMVSTDLASEVLANGGDPALAEPYEGALVTLYGLEVIDATGYTGPESNGSPHWWIKLAGDIYVANDFGITDKSFQAGDVIDWAMGVVSYRHGVYVLVPRYGSDLWQNSGWF